MVSNTNPSLVDASIFDNTLTLSYLADAFGPATVVVRATDTAGHFAEDVISLTVESVNDAPVVTQPIGPVVVDEDAADSTFDLSDVFDDTDALTYSVSSNTSPSLVEATIAGNTLTLGYQPNQNGTATIVVRATDTAGLFVEDTISLNVTAVNDAPAVVVPIGPVTVDENAADSTFDLTGVFADVDTSGGDTLTYSVADNTSPTLVDTSISDGTLTLHYQPNQFGSATIVVRATDSAGQFAEDTISLTVNMVDRTLVIEGTAGDDLFELTLGDVYLVSLNGNVSQYPAVSVDSITFNGGGGHDTAILMGSAGDETVELRPGAATLLGQGIEVYVNGADSIVANGGGGQDRVTFYDSNQDDLFESQANAGVLSGPDLLNVAGDFDVIIAYANAGGNDVARFEGTPGNDLYVATANYGGISGDGYAIHTQGFQTVEADGSAGGFDMAKLYDSPGDDTFVGNPTEAVMSGEGFERRAMFFGSVHAYATAGGNDVAEFYDSPGDDVFWGRDIDGGVIGDTFFLRAKHFEKTMAYADAGGRDVAKLYDSPGDDMFVATPTYGSLSGEGFNHTVFRFDEVHAFGTAAGYDVAKFYDSAGDDLFYGDARVGSMFQPDVYWNRAKWFEEVHAYATAGGYDRAELFDSAGDDMFISDDTSGALFGDGFYRRAKHFEEVNAHSTLGGNDEAYLYDSALSDLLEADGNWARLSNVDLDFEYSVEDFAYVKAHSQGPGDVKSVSDAVDFLFYEGNWEDQ